MKYSMFGLFVKLSGCPVDLWKRDFRSTLQMHHWQYAPAPSVQAAGFRRAACQVEDSAKNNVSHNIHEMAELIDIGRPCLHLLLAATNDTLR